MTTVPTMAAPITYSIMRFSPLLQFFRFRCFSVAPSLEESIVQKALQVSVLALAVELPAMVLVEAVLLVVALAAVELVT